MPMVMVMERVCVEPSFTVTALLMLRASSARSYTTR